MTSDNRDGGRDMVVQTTVTWIRQEIIVVEQSTTEGSNNINVFKQKICMACLSPLFIVHLYMGQAFYHDCPLQPFIPVFLNVAGAFLLVKAVVTCFTSLSSQCMALDSLLSLFLFCWFICGNVWIYSIYPPNYNNNHNYNQTTGEFYCYKHLYLYAFWTTALTDILTGVGVFLGLLLCIRVWTSGS